MQNEHGDDYIRRIASFIRSNERGLAEAVIARPRRAPRRPPESASVFNPVGWFSDPAAGTSVKPVVLSIDTHHLFYLLMRLEAIGIDVGTLDVRIDCPSRPLSYINVFPDPDKSETLSLSSVRSSLSVVSNLSLGAGWWSRAGPTSIDAELKYLFSSFTKLPALSITAPGRKGIAELVNEPPNKNAIPMDSFKNLQSLECIDIDPRALLGWDKLAESLWSLKIKKSGLEDVSDIFIGAVLDDQARREGSASRKRRRRIPQGVLKPTSFHFSQLPDSVPEDANGETTSVEPVLDTTGTLSPSPPPSQLSPRKWEWLKQLSLSDNALTFFPSELNPYLSSLTHLDLSSNLLVSIPPGLGALYNLISLNVSDNMIDSVLGIYQNLGQVLFLNLSHNRLESICGLERLRALERVDLRGNLIEEAAEIGRLASLPNISDVWVENNPLVELEEAYRIACLDYFWKEGKTVKLDGVPPRFYEKHNLTAPPSQQMTSSRPVSAAYSPPTIAVGHPHPHSQTQPGSPLEAVDKKPSPSGSSNPSPHLGPVSAVGVSSKGRRRKPKRIVDLDIERSNPEAVVGHRRTISNSSVKIQSRASEEIPLQSDTQVVEPFNTLHQAETIPQHSSANVPTDDFNVEHVLFSSEQPTQQTASPARRSRHSRFHSQFTPSLADDQFNEPPEDALAFRRSRNSQTFSSSALRRARVTASVYEPSTIPYDGDERNVDEGEVFRRRIEALKQDMGDGWLKVFSQSQMKTSP
ncbi:hypothetical protein E1B28_000777 [Marasmius oreades]|uniref:Uncharacterized protein n=1 Tax=Marasmius oreades TaxID=181124 RepID=A0A9P8AEP9_9AGAR|nr:uncharacterized protein E1B28_000777 [Marasmius oreades]KAG7098877.1 hypothetical protein E1B28_000777 [Marasmius oreades]